MQFVDVHPGSEIETSRLAAVSRYEILDTPADGAFDRITAIAAHLFRVPIAVVSIVDHDRIWFKSHYGIDSTQIGRDPGLCASAILGDEVWVIEHADIDPRTLSNPLVAGELGLRFYAGAPLRTHDGHNLGTLCVIDRQPRAFGPADSALLERLADIVIHELEVRLAAREAVREIAARQQREEELRAEAERLAAAATIRTAEVEAAIGAITEAFFLVGPNGQVMLANPSARAMLAGAKRLNDLLATLRDDRGSAPTLGRIERRGVVELTVAESGDSFEGRAYRVPLRDPGHDPSLGTATVLILRDVTQERRIAEIRGAFAGILAHELRTPVTSIYAGAHLLARDGASPSGDLRQGLAGDVAAEADRLRELIEDLLVVTQAEGRELQVDLEPLDVPAVLDAFVVGARHRWPDHRIELAVHRPVPPIRGDARYVRQILGNLISNAARFSDAGTLIEILVTHHGTWVELRVSDEGPGIAPSDRVDLFEIRRASAPGIARKSGAGIGLFVCRTLAEAMGGTIRIEERRVRGSGFVLRLPSHVED